VKRDTQHTVHYALPPHLRAEVKRVTTGHESGTCGRTDGVDVVVPEYLRRGTERKGRLSMVPVYSYSCPDPCYGHTTTYRRSPNTRIATQSTEQHTYMNIPLRTEHIPLQGPVRLTIRSTPILLSRTLGACAERVQHPDPSSLHTYDAFGGEGIEVGGLDAASGVHEVHLIVAQVLCSGGAGCGAGGGTRATAAGVDRVSHGRESFLPSAST
jgi:hypothetical protein